MKVVILTASLLTFNLRAEDAPVLTETLSVVQVNEDGFGDINNQYAFAMEPFKGDLYVGTLNAIDPFPWSMAQFFLSLPFPTNGTDIWRGRVSDDGTYDWTKVVASGLSNQDNFGVSKMKTVGDYLYAVTANHKSGFEVWRTNDGETWKIVSSGGFGDLENTSGRG